MTQKAHRIVGGVSEHTRLLTLKREASLNQAILGSNTVYSSTCKHTTTNRTNSTQQNSHSKASGGNRQSVSRQSLGSNSSHLIPFPSVPGSRPGHLTTKSTHSTSNKGHKNKRNLLRSQNLQAIANRNSKQQSHAAAATTTSGQQTPQSTVFRNKGSVAGFSSFTRRSSNANSQSTSAFVGSALLQKSLQQSTNQHQQSKQRDLNSRSIQKKHLLLNRDRTSISNQKSPQRNERNGVRVRINDQQTRSLAQSGFIQKISNRKYSTVTSTSSSINQHNGKSKGQGSLSNNLGAKINEILSHAKKVSGLSSSGTATAHSQQNSCSSRQQLADIDRLKSELSKYCGKNNNLNPTSKPTRSLISKGQLVGQSHNSLFGGTTRVQKASRLHQRHGTDVAVSGNSVGLNFRSNTRQNTTDGDEEQCCDEDDGEEEEEEEEPSIIAVDAAQLFEQKEQIENRVQNQNETKDVDQIDIRVENVELRKSQLHIKGTEEETRQSPQKNPPEKQFQPVKASNLLSQWRKIYESPLLNVAPISQRIYKAAPSERSRSGKATGRQIVTGETGMKKSFSIAQIQTVHRHNDKSGSSQRGSGSKLAGISRGGNSDGHHKLHHPHQQQLSEYGPRGSPKKGAESQRSASFEETYGRKEKAALKRSESIQSLSSSGASILSSYRRPIVVADRGTSQMGVLKNLAQSTRQPITKLFQNKQQSHLKPSNVKVASVMADEQATANVIRETGSVLKKFKFGDSVRSSINSQNFVPVNKSLINKVQPQSCKNSQIFGYKVVPGQLSNSSRQGGGFSSSRHALNSRKTSIDNQSGSPKFEELSNLRQAVTPSHQFAPKKQLVSTSNKERPQPQVQINQQTIQDENGQHVTNNNDKDGGISNFGSQKSKAKLISNKNSMVQTRSKSSQQTSAQNSRQGSAARPRKSAEKVCSVLHSLLQVPYNSNQKQQTTSQVNKQSIITNKVLKRQGSAIQINQNRLAQNRNSVPHLQSLNDQALNNAKRREQNNAANHPTSNSAAVDRSNEQWQLQQPNIQNLKRKSMIVSPIIGHQTAKSNKSRQISVSGVEGTQLQNKTNVSEPKQTPLLFKKSPGTLEAKKVEKRTIRLPESKKMVSRGGMSPKENVKRVISQGQSSKEINKSIEKQGKFVDRLINFIEQKSPKTTTNNKVQQLQEQQPPQVNQLIQSLLKATLKTRQTSLEKLEKPVLSPRTRSKSREDSSTKRRQMRPALVTSKKKQNQVVLPATLEQSGQQRDVVIGGYQGGTSRKQQSQDQQQCQLQVDKGKFSVNQLKPKVVQKVVQNKKKSESVTPVTKKSITSGLASGALCCEQSPAIITPNTQKDRQSATKSPDQAYYAPPAKQIQHYKNQILNNKEDDSYSKISKSFKMHFSGVSPNECNSSSISKMTPPKDCNFSNSTNLAKDSQSKPLHNSVQALLQNNNNEGQSGQQNYYTVKAGGGESRSGMGSSSSKSSKRFLSRQSSQNTLPMTSHEHKIIMSPKSELRDRSSSQRLSEAKGQEGPDLDSPVQICIKPYIKSRQHQSKYTSQGNEDEQMARQRGELVEDQQKMGTFSQKNSSTVQRKASVDDGSDFTSVRSTDTLVSSIKRHFSTPQGWVLPFQTSLRCYRVDKIVGKGAFGKVALAFQRLTEKPVAIKMIDKESLQPGQLEKVQTEVRLMSAIRHKNIIRLLEVFETQQYLFMVFEYAKNGDLLQLVKKTGCLTEEEAVPLFRQVVYGIAHCHCRSVLHRDIKLDNILLDARFNVKICDFGISRLIPDPSEAVFEQCGTPAYIAPEILCEDGYKGFKSDIWGLGVLLYTMVTGTVPFRAQNMAELRQVITQGHFQFPAKHPRDCLDGYSPEIKDLIRRCLCVDIDNRISIPDILNHPWLNPPFIPHQIQQQGLNIQQLLSLHALQPFNSSKNKQQNGGDFLSLDRQEQSPDDAVCQIKLENLFPQAAQQGKLDMRTMTQDDVDEVTIDRATVNINEIAVAQLEKCGFPKKLTRVQVQANVLSHATAAYHLLVL